MSFNYKGNRTRHRGMPNRGFTSINLMGARNRLRGVTPRATAPLNHGINASWFHEDPIHSGRNWAHGNLSQRARRAGVRLNKRISITNNNLMGARNRLRGIAPRATAPLNNGINASWFQENASHSGRNWAHGNLSKRARNANNIMNSIMKNPEYKKRIGKQSGGLTRRRR